MLTLTTAQMKRAERLCDESGISYAQMMDNAGSMAYKYLAARYELPRKHCVILAGSGNNGGDGFVVACRMLESGVTNGNIPVVILCAGLPRTELAIQNYNRMVELGGCVIDPSEDKLPACGYLQNAQIIIDAVFGTGFHGDVPPLAAELIGCANVSPATRIALDVPSGVNADSGVSGEICFLADVTLSFAAYKPAHGNLLSKPSCGLVEVLDIGIPGDIIFAVYNNVIPITPEMVQSLLPVRNPESHKGTYGRLLNLAGSRRMGGAAMMCTLSSMRAGAGLVTLATPESVARMVAPHLMEAMTLPLPEAEDGSVGEAAVDELRKLLPAMSACTVGCGLSLAPGVKKVLRYLLETAACPLVLDADALNCISTEITMLDHLAKVPILTPHASEMARLAGMTTAQVVENAMSVARLFAREHGCVVVLKGHRTIIATPEGELFQNTTGNAGLAKGGSGDVLTGIIGAFAAQGMSPRNAAVCGVFLHGMAADSLDGRMSQYSMLARDVISELPLVLKQLGR